MSNHVAFDLYNVREARDVAAYNTAQTAITAKSATLDASNITEEGLDEQQMAAQIAVGRSFTPISETTPANLSVTGAWTAFAFSGTTFQTGAITLAANELMRLRARVQLESQVTSGQLGISASAALVGMRLRYQVTGSGATTLTTSQRWVQRPTGGGSGGADKAHGTISLFDWVLGAVALDWVEMQYFLSAGTCRPSKALLYGFTFKQVN